ncbi:MAG: polysaccharide export outer membrane protein [Arcticibacterium sp.]|jgi:polysaccharide export outer membrane protein
MKTRKHLFFIFLSLFLSAQTFSQSPVNVDDISDAQIGQFIKEAESRGLSEVEMEVAAMANGYTALDVVKIREKIDGVKSGTNNLSDKASQTTREQIGEVAKRTDLQVIESTKVLKKLEVFGRSIFNNKNLSFEPNLRLPTPKDYVLGPEDKLNIDITGYAYQHYEVVVSPEGTIKLESLAPIHISGLTVAEAKSKITDRLKLLFGGLRNGKLNADVTLGDLRSIKVTLVGEIENPGTYTVSSFATVFNALYLAGGPTEKGSFRNIRLLRGNKERANLDLYPFLLNGLQDGNEMLQDQDVIFVSMARTKVTVEGEVKREGIYELMANESLKEVVDYAGGFSEMAYKDKINITRSTGKEKKLITAEGVQLDMYALQNGDKILVGAILDRFTNKVEVSGAVFRPGEFALDDSIKTIKDLIRAASGLRKDAFLDRVLLVRERENLDPEINSFNLKELLDGSIQDIVLKRNDQLIVKSIAELRELRTVEIQGSVNQPGVFKFAEGMFVKDLILLSGGFTEGATTKRIEIAKRLFNDESSNETVKIYFFETNKALNHKEGIVLSPFDKVFVRDLPNYEEQKLVKISGEVNYPGTYTILKREERISDLIKRAGGLREESYIEGARFYREGMLVALDLKKALNNENDLGNLILSESDKLVIPKLQEVIKLSGQVLNPTSVAFRPDLRFQDYIAQAGGVSNDAFVRKTYVRYANGLTDRTRSFLGIKNYPEIQRGMEVIVPARIKDRWTSAERIAISTAFVSIATIMVTIIRIL